MHNFLPTSYLNTTFYRLQKKGDFIVDEKYHFEVDDSNKLLDQIKDNPNNYLAIVGIAVGYTTASHFI